MAIDSQAKRASVLGVVQPDGTIDQGDRQTVLRIYRGILAVPLVLAVGWVKATVTARMGTAAVTSRMGTAAVAARTASATVSARS